MFEADSSSSVVSSTSSNGIGITINQNKHGEIRSENGTKGSEDFDLGNIDATYVSKLGEGNEEEKVIESIHSNPEQSSILSSTTLPVSSTKAKAQKICQVCGDNAKSFHFGGLSCDSCKAFFRRSVHNDAYEGFQCAYTGKCEINKNSRKSCQYCRFHKCISIGMEKKWVMTEEERNQIKQKKQATKSNDSPKSSTESRPNATSSNENEDNYEPNVNEMLNFMTQEEKDEIECIVNKYQHSYREIPFKVSRSGGSRNSVEIIQMFTTILRRFAYFTKLFPEFTQLSIQDQSTLLRASVLEMCLLRGALCFDMKNNRWPKTENMEFLKDCPQLRVEDMEKLVSKDLYDMHIQFINGVQELGADEPTVMILLLIVLFYPERGALEHQQYIANCQERYLLLLNKYVRWRYGPKGSKTFPRLLTKLADLRQLNDSHTEYNLKMTKNEVETIQEQLGNLNLNPYPQWVLVQDQLNDPTNTEGVPDYNYDATQHVPATEQDSEQQHRMQQAQAAYQLHAQQQQGNVSQDPSVNVQMQAPQPRDFFMQFVNHKIPALINNPFTPFSMEAELANARTFFQSSMGMGMPSAYPQQQDQRFSPMQTEATQGAAAGNQPISQFKHLLENSDPNMLRQLKDSLSPNVLSKLQSVFGSETNGSGAGQFDISQIPPEYLSSYMEHQQAANNVPYDHQQQQQGVGYPENPFSTSYESHPLAQYSTAQVTEHFQNLQQHFRSPNTFQVPQYNMGTEPAYYSQSQAPSGTYEYNGTGTHAQHDHHQQQQHEHGYQNW